MSTTTITIALCSRCYRYTVRVGVMFGVVEPHGTGRVTLPATPDPIDYGCCELLGCNNSGDTHGARFTPDPTTAEPASAEPEYTITVAPLTVPLHRCCVDGCPGYPWAPSGTQPHPCRAPEPEPEPEPAPVLEERPLIAPWFPSAPPVRANTGPDHDIPDESYGDGLDSWDDNPRDDD